MMKTFLSEPVDGKPAFLMKKNILTDVFSKIIQTFQKSNFPEYA